MQAEKRAAAQARQDLHVLRAVQEHQEQHNYKYDPRYNDPESEDGDDSENGENVVSSRSYMSVGDLNQTH